MQPVHIRNAVYVVLNTDRASSNLRAMMVVWEKTSEERETLLFRRKGAATTTRWSLQEARLVS